MPDQPLFLIQTSTLRAIIEGTNAAPILAVARQPGVSAVYRLTVFHHDGRARDSVATLIHRRLEGPQLDIVYRTAFGGKPLVHPVPPRRYEALVAGLHGAGFDRLTDQPDLPPYGVDLWLLERASGGFTRGVILAPAIATGVHAVVVETMQTHLPEALREVH